VIKGQALSGGRVQSAMLRQLSAVEAQVSSRRRCMVGYPYSRIGRRRHMCFSVI
jgi:hypothetical protein